METSKNIFSKGASADFSKRAFGPITKAIKAQTKKLRKKEWWKCKKVIAFYAPNERSSYVWWDPMLGSPTGNLLMLDDPEPEIVTLDVDADIDKKVIDDLGFKLPSQLIKETP